MNILEKRGVYRIKKSGKYLSPKRTWTKNLTRSLEFDTEKEATKFLKDNSRIKGGIYYDLHQTIIRSFPYGKCVVEFNLKEVRL